MTALAPARPLTIADLEQYKLTATIDPTYPANLRTFYSPHDNVHAALKAVIGSTTKSLVIAMYGYDDDELAQMVADIIDNEAIYTQITLDKSQAGGVHERTLLEKFKHEMDSNSVAIGTSEHGAIMHRKMVIVDGLWRISGSTNWSTSGESLQDNELTVIQSAAACAEARHILDIEHNKALKQMAKAQSIALQTLSQSPMIK
jgi:phosphatidylserine/phosphatidylglycerophosphate/cardiolipin synthase-like enzyme